MGEWVRCVNPDGNVEPKKTTDALLEKMWELIIERDALRLEVAMHESEPTA